MAKFSSSKRAHKKYPVDPVADADKVVPPTPETLTKRRSDVVLTLVRRGKISPDHLLACEEIRTVWESWCRGLFPTAQRFDSPHSRSAGQVRYRDPMDRMKYREFEAWSRRYLPWSQEMRVEILARCAITRHQLVMDIVIDNFGPRQIEDYYGLRHGTAVPFLQGALERYCKIAGWT